MPKSSYDEIAAEYYDPGHVTSRNFDSATRVALREKPFKAPDGLVLEVGAGRGRATEFLGIEASRIVQLDNSEAMFALKEREPSFLQVHADACNIPLVSGQFSSVVGFLVDPFLGLDCLAEAYRMLADQGQLLFTVPTREWGEGLREQLGIDVMTTRFKLIGTEKIVRLPSLLHHKSRIFEMLKVSGFKDIEISDHCLPKDEEKVSPDISSVCKSRQVKAHELPIIYIVRGRR